MSGAVGDLPAAVDRLRSNIAQLVAGATVEFVDETTGQLRAVATKLADVYFDRVFTDAHKEFEVHGEQRRSLRSGTVEQGLRLWLPFRQPDDVIWLVARRRRLFGQKWDVIASVDDVEANARQALDEWAATQR